VCSFINASRPFEANWDNRLWSRIKGIVEGEKQGFLGKCNGAAMENNYGFLVKMC